MSSQLGPTLSANNIDKGFHAASNPTKSKFSAKTAIFLQNACLQHRYIRSKNLSAIVERPERLRAVTIGLAAGIARLEEAIDLNFSTLHNSKNSTDSHDLISAMDNMNLASATPPSTTKYIQIVESNSTVELLNHPAVKFIHGDMDSNVYPTALNYWAKQSWNKISKGESEIPAHLSQGDLYLCPESVSAMEGALGAICEAIDTINAPVQTRSSNEKKNDHNMDLFIRRAFLAVRPPGHHCGEDSPSGFCFINNIAVAAAHAHLRHGINRIVIFDIDLHHGNGTQSIVWKINEESYRQTLEAQSGAPQSKSGPQIYYGSIHDILSYPCEDGKVDLVQAASVSLHQAHGQFIENIHLDTYSSEGHFWNDLYKNKYSGLFRKAEEFLDNTGGPGEDVMVLISCGMDACEHEHESMSRHNRKVPSTFYYRFARDACKLSDKYGGGKLLSVLEGGYSDRALISGSMAHIAGLVDVPSPEIVNEEWWNLTNLTKLENATKKRRGGRLSATSYNPTDTWLEKAMAIFAPLEVNATKSLANPTSVTIIPPMTLRERKKGNNNNDNSDDRNSVLKLVTGVKELYKAEGGGRRLEKNHTVNSSLQNLHEDTSSGIKKLPRVVLKLGKPPEATLLTSSGTS